MYISEAVKEQLRPYEGQAIELEALEVDQPWNPGEGLIRKLRVLGPAPLSRRPFTFDGIRLSAQPIANGSPIAVELTVSNDRDTVAKIDSSEIGFVLLSQKTEGASGPSDGPSIAVITRTNIFTGRGTWISRTDETVYVYLFAVDDALRFPQSLELAPHTSRSTQISFELPAGHYQFFAGYGGGVHDSKMIVSNPVSIERW